LRAKAEPKFVEEMLEWMSDIRSQPSGKKH
jgi:hypothetical protein